MGAAAACINLYLQAGLWQLQDPKKTKIQDPKNPLALLQWISWASLAETSFSKDNRQQNATP